MPLLTAGVIGPALRLFLIAWLCPVCEDTVLSRLRLLLGASVGGGRLHFSPSSEKKEEHSLLLLYLLALLCSVVCQLLSFSRHVCLRALGLHVSVFLRIGVWACCALDMCILLWCFQLLLFPVFGCFVAVFRACGCVLQGFFFTPSLFVCFFTFFLVFTMILNNGGGETSTRQ